MIDCDKERAEMRAMLKKAKKENNKYHIEIITDRLEAIDRVEVTRDSDCISWMLEIITADNLYGGDLKHLHPLKANSRATAISEAKKILKKEIQVVRSRLYSVRPEKLM